MIYTWNWFRLIWTKIWLLSLETNLFHKSPVDSKTLFFSILRLLHYLHTWTSIILKEFLCLVSISMTVTDLCMKVWHYTSIAQMEAGNSQKFSLLLFWCTSNGRPKPNPYKITFLRLWCCFFKSKTLIKNPFLMWLIFYFLFYLYLSMSHFLHPIYQKNITELFLFQLLKSLFDKKNIKISSLLST